jgi:hypothetical protein
MRLGHGLCVWPGDACAVADDAALAHLPPEVRADLPTLTVVGDGEALMGVVRAS